MAERQRSPHQFGCRLDLDKPRNAYYAGETIYGEAKILAFYDDLILNISVTFQGVTKVHWDEKVYMSPRVFRVLSFKSAEEHISVKKIVMFQTKINKGCYTYKFKFLTQKNFPTSIESAYGYTRYEMTLVVHDEYESKFAKEAISITQIFDLNLNPKYKRAIETQIRSTLFWLPCISSYLISLKIPQRAYVSGQMLEYELRVKQPSNSFRYRIDFEKKVTLRTEKKDRTFLSVLILKYFEVTNVFRDNVNLFGYFEVPITAPTTSRLSILAVEYFLSMSVKLSPNNERIKVSVPVIIGTRPIRKKISVNISEEQPAPLQAVGIAAQRAAQNAAHEDNDDIATTSQAATESAREQESQIREIKKPKGESHEIGKQPTNSQASRTATQSPEEEKTEFKEAAHTVLNLENYSDDESTTPQAAERRQQKKDLDDNDDIPTTTAERAAAESAREQESQIREIKKPKDVGHEIDKQPTTSQTTGTAEKGSGEEETKFHQAAYDEIRIYDLEDNDDMPSTSHAARARMEKLKAQEIEKKTVVEQKVKQPEFSDQEIDNQPINSQAASTVLQRPEKEETEFQEAEHDELKVIDIEEYSDDKITTLQAAERAREQDIEKKEVVEQKVKKPEVADHEIDNQPSNPQAERAPAARAREQVPEEEIDMYYELHAQEFHHSDFTLESFIDDDCDERYRIEYFNPVYPVYSSPPPSRRQH